MSDVLNRIEIDRRDWNSLRERVCKLESDLKKLFELEDQIRQIRREVALFQQGAKERFDVISVLLSRSEDAVDRKDLG